MEIPSPYTPPTEIGSDPSRADLDRKKKFWKRSIWITLALFLIPPMIGLIGTVIGMRRAFAAIGDSGIGDPTALAAAIGETLIATASGFILSIPCLVLLIISIVRFRSYRAKLRTLSA